MIELSDKLRCNKYRSFVFADRAEVDVPNDAAVGGNTPLHLSIMRHYTNVAMLLLHAGADFDLVSTRVQCGETRNL